MSKSGNIADKLRQPRRPWRTLIAVGAIVLVGVAGFSVSGALLKPEAARPAPTIVHLVGNQGKPTVPQIEHKLLLTDHVAKSTTPPPPPEPVYVAPPSGGGGGGSNSGALVPFIPSSDPNNAAGGDYLDPGSYCTSGSASGFPPRCD